jgi:hypothetical protein
MLHWNTPDCEEMIGDKQNERIVWGKLIAYVECIGE